MPKAPAPAAGPSLPKRRPAPAEREFLGKTAAVPPQEPGRALRQEQVLQQKRTGAPKKARVLQRAGLPTAVRKQRKTAGYAKAEAPAPSRSQGKRTAPQHPVRPDRQGIPGAAPCPQRPKPEHSRLQVQKPPGKRHTAFQAAVRPVKRAHSGVLTGLVPSSDRLPTHGPSRAPAAVPANPLWSRRGTLRAAQRSTLSPAAGYGEAPSPSGRMARKKSHPRPASPAAEAPAPQACPSRPTAAGRLPAAAQAQEHSKLRTVPGPLSVAAGLHPALQEPGVSQMPHSRPSMAAGLRPVRQEPGKSPALFSLPSMAAGLRLARQEPGKSPIPLSHPSMAAGLRPARQEHGKFQIQFNHPSAAELRPVWQEPAGPPIHHKGLSIMELPRLTERELCRRYIPARAHSIFRGQSRL